MTDRPQDRWLQTRLETNRFTVQPGKTVSIPAEIENLGDIVDHLEFSIEGIPSDWLGADLPIVMLPPGEIRQVTFVVQPPSSPRIRAGTYPLILKISSLRQHSRFLEVDLFLIVAAAAVLEPIGLFLAQDEFSVQPGGEIKFPLVVANRGFLEDTFLLSVGGIPGEWFTANRLRLKLSPGEEEEIFIEIAPPKQADSAAGDHLFYLQVVGEDYPRNHARLEGKLQIFPYYEFQTDLSSTQLRVDETAVLTLKNLGNSMDIYTVCFYQPQDRLVFQVLSPTVDAIGLYRDTVDKPHLDPWGVAVSDGNVYIRGDDSGAFKGLLLHIPAGEKLALEFRPQVLQAPAWQEIQEFYQVEVDSSRLERQTLEGTVAVAPVAYPRLVRVILGLFLIAFTAAFVIFGMLFLRMDLIPAVPTSTVTQTQPSPVILFTITQPPPTITFTPTIESTPTGTLTPVTATLTLTATPTLPLPPTETLAQETDTPTPTSFAPTSTIVVFPIQDQGRILGETDILGRSHVFIFDTSSRFFDVLNENPGENIQPAWSPDGKRVAYATDQEGGQFDIYVMNIETGVVFNLTNNLADDREPTWSPDGQWIAFTTDRDNNKEIYAVDLATYNLLNLSQNQAEDSQPDWFLDQRIAFTTNRDGNQEIYLMNEDGSGQSNLTRNSSGNDYSPAGSRDGSQIAFVSDRDGNPEIYKMLLDGSSQTNLTLNGSQDDSPTWSPDSQWIAFASNRSVNWDIFVIRPDGSQPYNITSIPSDEKAPAWIDP